MAPDSPPHSPWTTRWPKREDPPFRWDNTIHTGLAPELPRIDNPIQSLDTPFAATPFRRQAAPSNRELDILFRTESFQSEQLLGMLTWQAVTLNRWVNFSPDQVGPMSGGHLPSDVGDTLEASIRVYEENKLKVDESRWFRFIKKQRWYDWIETNPPGNVPGRVWSIDDPKIWNELGICLELVDRMFKALIEDKHDAGSVANSAKSFINDQSTTEAQDMSVIGRNFTSMTLLGTRRIETLMNSTLTIAERCALQVNIAISVVHETCHAIFQGRFQNYLPYPKYPSKVNVESPIEPYIGCQGITELGHNMEQHFFGGSTTFLHIGLGIVSHEIPNATRKDENGIGDWRNPGAIIKGCYIQASWTSKLLSEAYWKDETIGQKSANYFHRPFIFVNRSVNLDYRPRDWGPVRIHPNELGVLSTSSSTDKLVVQAWNERQGLWRNFRANWYDVEKRKWEASPWERVPYIMKIHEFASAFARGDEIKCSRIAIQLTHIVDWSKDQNTFIKYMPKDSRDLHPSWVFHCIGLLMMASIPIRRAPLERATVHPDWTYSTVPSRDAAAAGHKNTISIPRGGDSENYSTLPSQLYDQLNNRGQLTNFTQLDYLDLAAATVNKICGYAPAYWGWVGAMMDGYHALLEDRRRILQQVRNAHRTRWASNWPFKVPAYDTEVGIFRDNVFKKMTWNEEGGLVYVE
ncbi:hypothetical protein F4678DRAFT_486021 [Xylaria arbuscula]|nr:hypothetical protein F4678DRAFT_486021 [Xylaria arbuscula]